MGRNVEEFYDSFSSKFVEDIIGGNERVQQQLMFFSRTLPSSARSILVIGAGSGQGAYYLATQVAKAAKILAIDISLENLRLARAIYEHPNIEYRKVDVTQDQIDREWEAIVLPDVYEHIPIAARQVVHEKLNRLLVKDGKILLTVPSPGKQASLYAKGEGLQVVDEIVSLEDLSQLARDVGGVLTYFNMISVWETNDYIHAVVERTADRVRPIGEDDMVPIKGWEGKNLFHKGRSFLSHKLGIRRLGESWRRRRIENRLSRASDVGPASRVD